MAGRECYRLFSTVTRNHRRGEAEKSRPDLGRFALLEIVQTISIEFTALAMAIFSTAYGRPVSPTPKRRAALLCATLRSAFVPPFRCSLNSAGASITE
jgi:hypothetical protein